jgi:restriction endonuclease S subunit
MREVYISKMEGAVDRRRSISPDVFLDIEIPLPPLDIRKAVLKKHQQVESAAASIKTLEHEIDESLKELWDDDSKED